VWNNVVSLQEARGKRGVVHEITLRAVGSNDPHTLARQLCEHLAAQSELLKSIASQTLISNEAILVGTVYAHVLGWIVYTNSSITLTSAGRAAAQKPAAAWPKMRPRRLIGDDSRCRRQPAGADPRALGARVQRF
jgi:hypothetical protein